MCIFRVVHPNRNRLVSVSKVYVTKTACHNCEWVYIWIRKGKEVVKELNYSKL